MAKDVMSGLADCSMFSDRESIQFVLYLFSIYGYLSEVKQTKVETIER